MDLLFVNVGGFRKKVYQELSKDFSAIEPPFWAALSAGFIRNKGFEVGILDANAENLDIQETIERIEQINPKLVNIVNYGQHPSASTQIMSIIENLCKELKETNKQRKIILTGLHPSALPKRTIQEVNCDFVGEGEGFYTLLGLLQGKEKKEIPGLWWIENNEIRNNPRAELIKYLSDELPDVAWDLLPMDKYKAHNWHCLGDLESRHRYASISTSLGCPFNCSFCCINAPFGKHMWRTWNSEWVLRQIDILVKKYNVKNIKFIDELFVLKPEHFIPILDGLIERDYGVNIWAYARVDTTKEEYLEKLKKAGVNWLALGFEAGNEEVMKEVSKSQFTKKDVIEIRNKIKTAGINVIGNYIFGLPEDTLKSMQETLDLAIELNCEWANFYSASAYPGSRLYDSAIENNLPLPDSWDKFAQHHYEFMPLPTKHISAKEVLKFRDDAFMKYFTNPEFLKMIEERFGKKTLEHVQEMTKIKLKRKILEDEKNEINQISFRSIGISHEDERRTLKEIFNSKDELKDFIARHCKVMEIKTDSNLGGVYHDYAEIIYILKGEVFIELKNLDDNKEMSMILKQGDRIVIPKNTAHKLKAEKDTIIVELWETPHISSDINNHKIEF